MAIGDPNVIIDNGLMYNTDFNVSVGGVTFNPKALGFHLLSQSMLEDNPKQRETISYIERDGEETAPALIDSVTNKYPKEAFDYVLEFAYFNKTDYDFEAKLSILKRILNEGGVPPSATRDTLQIRNEYTNTKIIGYYKGISITTYERKIYDNTKDYQEIKVTFRVPKPNSCNFNGLN